MNNEYWEKSQKYIYVQLAILFSYTISAWEGLLVSSNPS